MKLKDHNTSDTRGPYRVPEGYFSDLRHTIIEKAQAEPVDNSWSGAFRRLLGFAGGFAFLAALAAGLFYLTPKNMDVTHNNLTKQSQSISVEEFTMLYNVSEDDILDYYYMTDTSSDSGIVNTSFAQAIDDYLETYGVEYINE